jgi:hypothetical protein
VGQVRNAIPAEVARGDKITVGVFLNQESSRFLIRPFFRLVIVKKAAIGKVPVQDMGNFVKQGKPEYVGSASTDG